VPGTVRSVLYGQRPVIRSDGQYIRDYFYAEDGAHAYAVLAEQLTAAPEKLRGHAFNFSNEQRITVLELVRRILELTGSDLEPDIRNEANNEIRDQYLSTAKARGSLSWEPLFTLDEGLRRTIEWYTAYLGVQQPQQTQPAPELQRVLGT
jgi:CDP-glucose 4,6-dehydratase